MFRQGLLLFAVLCSGVLGGYAMFRLDSPSTGDPGNGRSPDTAEPALQHNNNVDETLARLREQLVQAGQERQRLADRIARLEVDAGKSSMPADAGTGVSAEDADNNSKESGEKNRAYRTSVENLIEAGITAEQAAWIQARLDEYDLNMLYLKDRATREGWLRTSRYNQERREIMNAYQALRPEIGDDAYDRMLYALGRSNRVVVRDVIQNSIAEQYGLQANDRIILYDGQRVFTGQELTDLVSQGTAGVPVLVRVQRDDQQLDFYLPRGPVGIRLASSRELP
ncbi:MAG: PDZ domain-containing protein [Thiohalobacterales bacterium]|nr:PDZ domain-containing protein [Thiohalobacterales bacterium]